MDRNCTVPQLDPETGVAAPMCCDVAATSDFDVSADNATWYTGFALVRPSAFLPAWKKASKKTSGPFWKLPRKPLRGALNLWALGRRRRRGWG